MTVMVDSNGHNDLRLRYRNQRGEEQHGEEHKRDLLHIPSDANPTSRVVDPITKFPHPPARNGPSILHTPTRYNRLCRWPTRF